jgi:hypothetical protein
VSGELSAAAHPEMAAIGLQSPVWSLKAALAREQEKPPVTRGFAGVGGAIRTISPRGELAGEFLVAA